MKTLTLIATGSLLALGAAAHAVTIANWTFENAVTTNTGQTTGPVTAEAGLQAGVAAATGFHGSASTVWSNPSGNGSLKSLSSNNWSGGDFLQFKFSLVGFQSATISWDQTRSSTGPADFTMAVSTNGTTFTNVLSNYAVAQNGLAPLASWNTTTFNTGYSFGPIALGAATNGATDVYVRLISNVQTASGGTNRVDNVLVDATDVVPEPATMAVLGLIAAAAARRKRK